MNRPLFYLVLVVNMLLMGAQAFAQGSFAPIGAEWWYQGNNHDFTSGPMFVANKTWTDHVQVEGDTLINNINSRKVTVSRRYKSGGYGYGDTIRQEKTVTLFLYDNTDTVFVYIPLRNEFTPLYVFNVAVKDTIRLRAPFNTEDNDSLYLIVDSIVQENFGGHFLKTYYTSSYRFDSSGLVRTINYGSIMKRTNAGFTVTGKYTERLGMTMPFLSGFFPFTTVFVADYALPAEYPSGSLVCYKDNIYDIKMRDTACDFIPTPTSGIRSLQQKFDLTLSPNPSQGTIQIVCGSSLPKGTFIQLYDLSGKEMLPSTDISGKLKMSVDLSHLPVGMYILKMEGASIYGYHKIVVRN